MLTICALLVSNVGSQKGEFIMASHTRVSPCGVEGSTLPVTLLHIITNNGNNKQTREFNINYSYSYTGSTLHYE